MAQAFLAVQFLHHLRAGGLEFRQLGDEGEHHRQRPPLGRADQRLQLHPQHAGLVQPHADRAPAHRGVGFILRLHVGKHLVGPDIQRAEGHALAMGGIHDAGIERGEFGALGHLVADEELQFRPEEAHAFSPRSIKAGQVGHQPCIHHQRGNGAAFRLGGQATQGGIALLGGGLHGDLVAEGAGHRFLGAQVDDALVAIDKDLVAIQRLGHDAVGMDHQRDGQRAGHDGGMGADGAFFQHHALQLAPVVEQFGGADVARHQHGVFRHFRAGIGALAREDPQEAVRQIVQIVQPFAQIGVGHLFQTGAGGGLLFLDRGFGGEAALDVLLHPAQPAARIGEHAVGFQHRLLFLVEAFGGKQVIDRDAQLAHGFADAVNLGQGVVGDGVRHHDARFVQPDAAFGRPFLPGAAPDHHRLLVQRAHSVAIAVEDAKFGHFGQDHGDDFEGVDLVLREFAFDARLDDQNAKLFADPLDGHAEEGGIDLFPGFGHVAKALFARGIGGVDGKARARHPAHKTFAQFHARLVDGFGLQPFGGAEFEGFGIAEEVDRADLGSHGIGDQMGDAVKPVLPAPGGGERVAQPAQEFAAFAFGPFRHGCSCPCRDS